MGVVRLPTRRDEAWKYSDLRAAFGDRAPPPVALGDVEKPVIVQLAHAANALEHVALKPNENIVRVDRIEGADDVAEALHLDIPAGASVTRIVLQECAGIALNLARVRLGAGARFRQFVLAFGAKLARIETHVEVEGEGAEVALNGVYLCAAGRHADLTSQVAHRVGHGRTRQLIKGAVRAGGRGVFQGKISVAQGAQKTDAQQHHDALLLEEGAEVNAKPELEIYADDVACAHGNTAGALDDKALFYMRARGVPNAQARALLVEAFLAQALPDWLSADAREEVEERIAAWLGGAR
jgi:Fe-S cluster assembly protein SufD